MAAILRGEIWWADLDPIRGHEQGGSRPILVLSKDNFNTRTQTVIAMAITSQVPRVGFPASLEITSVKMPRRSWVKIDQVRTLSVDRLERGIGKVATQELDVVIQGLNQIIA